MKLSLLLIPALLLGLCACCSTTAEENPEGTVPPSPEVNTAGWESHPASDWEGFGSGTSYPKVGTATTAGTEPLGPMERRAELESLRLANKRLMSQVTLLMAEVEGVEGSSGVAAPSVAPEAVAMPAAPVAPVIAVDGVRSSLRGGAASDLAVSRNTEGQVVITIPGGVCFKSGKAALMTGAQTRLRSAVGALSGQYPNLSIRVEGHTDSDPIKRSKWASNQVLSEARAKAVRDFLVSNTMLGGDRLDFVGYGSTRPVAGNDTAQGKALNRRVELVLIP